MPYIDSNPIVKYLDKSQDLLRMFNHNLFYDCFTAQNMTEKNLKIEDVVVKIIEDIDKVRIMFKS